MVGALLSFSAMAVSIRELARAGLSIFEILAIRSGGSLIILFALLLLRPELRVHALPRRMGLNLTAQHRPLRLAIWLGAVSLTLLPLATVFALEFTMPAWTALLAVWLLHERMTPSRLGVVVFGLIGVLVILRPGIASFNPAALLVLAAAFGYAITMITTKQADHDRDHVRHHLLDGGDPVSALADRQRSQPSFLHLDAARHSAGARRRRSPALTSHYCLSNAFRAGDATLVVPLDFMRIPLIAVVGWAFYGEALDIFVLLGALIIIAGVLWNLRVGKRPRALTPANVILAPP